MTGKQLDWHKAHAKPARVLSWKEQRLDRAADNWIDHQTLCNKPPPAPDPPPAPPPKRSKKTKHRRHHP
jgi:hypothetical protein